MIEEHPNHANRHNGRPRSRPGRSIPIRTHPGHDSPIRKSTVKLYVLGPFFAACLFVAYASAETGQENQSRSLLASLAQPKIDPLPDAPTLVSPSASIDRTVFALAQSDPSSPQTPDRTFPTGHFDNLIDPHEIAPKLRIRDKVGMGLKASVSPFALIGWVGSATYSEAFNRSPNYGQSAQDYAQRLGAAAARSSSEGIFSTSVMAPILHEDPRYFVEGPGHPGLHRAFYAISRVIFTKTDDGRSRVNYALLSGNAIGAGLTQTYYPAGNRNLQGTMTTFGTSLAGSGVKFLLEEFLYRKASIAQLKSKFKPAS